ncbi:MAG: hypothetical protein JWP04_2041 [Belnapia sp.]|nr:hypothetical protein [Belnapia sp.]
MKPFIAVLLALAVPLAGCGRAGPPRPPGPREQLTYPRAYPAPDALPAPLRLAPPDTAPLAPLGRVPGSAPDTPETPPALR